MPTTIVTGAASGIGKATALLLAQDGHRLILADTDGESGSRLASQIEDEGGHARFCETDVTDEGAVETATALAMSAFGGLTGAVNCAGVHQAGKPTHQLTAEEWDRCNGVNLRGMFLCVKHQIGAMIEGGGGGSIVAISSAAATKGLLNSSDYCASKAGVLGLVRAAAIEYGAQDIRINALLPGATDTPLAHSSSKANPGLGEMIHVPLARWASPEEIAASAAWLLSDAASYVTGAAIPVDGGMTV